MENENAILWLVSVMVFFWFFSCGKFPIRGLISDKKEEKIEVILLHLFLIVRFLMLDKR